jgi:hypothetical protein
MSRVEAAAAMDRLPWLTDEPEPRSVQRPRSPLVAWSAGAVLALAAAGFWIAANGLRDAPSPALRRAAPTATLRLPAAHPVEPQLSVGAPPQVTPAPAPQVRPAPAREVPVAAPPAHDSAREGAGPVRERQADKQPATSPSAIAQSEAQIVPVNARNRSVPAGAAGRAVQVGAFGSARQAKAGRQSVARANPGVAGLPLTVQPVRNSKGRLFYRFQLGTTSQAHSEVLCQRMQKIGLSCVVVGLPRKVER